MTENEIWTLGIAAYAAVVSTIVLIWDVIKWLKSGPKLRVSVSYGMAMVGHSFVDKDKRFVLVKVVNRGGRPSTITHLGLMLYSSRLKAIFRSNNPDQAWLVNEQQLPSKVDAGEQWSGLVDQDDEVLQMIERGTLYVTINHSDSDKFVKARIRPKK